MSDSVSSDLFKAALRRFASGVTVVTCTVDGVDHAMTASAFNAVSLDPPLVLVCVRRTARFAEALRRTEAWGVSILAQSGQAASRWFATSGRPLEGQMDAFAYHRGSLGVALLECSLAHLQCWTASVIEAGDHDIVVGEVADAELNDQGLPLVYWEGDYRLLG